LSVVAHRAKPQSARHATQFAPVNIAKGCTWLLQTGDALSFNVREGEASVFEPDGNGGFKLIARVQASEWSRLAQALD
jgi:hypothetical protein